MSRGRPAAQRGPHSGGGRWTPARAVPSRVSRRTIRIRRPPAPDTPAGFSGLMCRWRAGKSSFAPNRRRIARPGSFPCPGVFARSSRCGATTPTVGYFGRQLTCAATRSADAWGASSEPADSRPEGSLASARVDLDEEEGCDREGQHQPESGVEGGVSCHRPALPRPSARGWLASAGGRVAGPSRPPK